MIYFTAYGFPYDQSGIYALKEGFNVRNGNSLKAYGDGRGILSAEVNVSRWRACFPLFFIARNAKGAE